MDKEAVEAQLKIPLKEVRPRGNNLELFINFGKIGEISGASIAANKIADQESKRLLWQNVWSEIRNDVIAVAKNKIEVKPDNIFIPMQNRLVKLQESRTSAVAVCIFEYQYNFNSKGWEIDVKQ